MAALREFLRAADPTLVTDNTEALNTDPRLSVTGDEVWDHAARLIVPDPVRDAILMLERTFPDIDVLNAGPTRFDLSGRFSNPSRAAADALVRLEAFPSICVVARGRENRVAALARHQNVLLWIELRPNHNVWYRTYRLTGMRNALGIVNDNETARAARLSEPPWTVVPQSARSVLHALRLDEQEFRDWQFADKGARY
ncbi:hypothetical protein [Nakamurella multipartita]|uniref:Uncharacterized protein n=1 Tax=Nakamurella multipartita (strain ATCC 700099 / DSM 44233 / CIP 104796 / JCM 9543 / NBRC 105858 / Y-104) TaxID=479431 RepID=C8X710_NAKMY|nr:hypothetical protein [Nakamurella multipartita]ACV76879.1 hypothetical protein Namu_0460 [Nakamurella multipartita DSM 44233]